MEPIDSTSPELLNGEELWLAYDRNTGASTTGHLAPDGTAHSLAQFQLDPTWEFILPTTGGIALFFRLSQDQVSTGLFGADGGFTDLVTSPLGGFFHRVTVLPAGLVMWNRTVSDQGQYRSVSVIGRVAPTVVTRSSASSSSSISGPTSSMSATDASSSTTALPLGCDRIGDR